MITQERLKEILTYDDSSGKFYSTPLRGVNKDGKEAGSKNGAGYLHMMIDRKKYKLHRLAWLYVNGEFPEGSIDHINQDKSDNRIENLRVVSQEVNMRNSNKRVDNTSGVTGVCWHKSTGKWRVKVGKKYYGVFEDKELAELVASEVYSKLGYHENHGR